MDRHHDMDALTAYNNQIKVYKPNANEKHNSAETVDEEEIFSEYKV